MSVVDVDGSSTGTSVPWMWALLSSHESEEQAMQTIATIGLDTAKSVFQQSGHRPLSKKPEFEVCETASDIFFPYR